MFSYQYFGGESLKVKIELDDSLSQNEVVIRCRDIDENILQLKRAAENLSTDTDIVFLKDNVQFFPSLDSILFFETAEHALNAHTADDIFQVKMKLFELENILPQKFVRISIYYCKRQTHLFRGKKHHLRKPRQLRRHPQTGVRFTELLQAFKTSSC